jgi:hypothetical protein
MIDQTSKNSYFIAVLLFFVLSACIGEQKPENKVTKYYDLKGLLNEQAGEMGRKGLTIQKEVQLNGKNESSQSRPDSLQWTEELESFYQLDLNKTVYRDAYEIEEKELEEGKKLSYVAKNPKKVAVEEMQLFFDQQQRLRELQAIYREKNQLYEARKKLTAKFRPLGQHIQLAEYSEEGLQKLVMSDSLSYSLHVQVLD